mmetsp:Transcript_13250/g.9338  ORF Transcript_13250/g.9338 Transcript_13250/m.9338 type:complete len:83 (-) Transcript_13250:1795-2043(-)
MDMGIVNAGKLPIYNDIEPKLRDLLTEVVMNESQDNDHVNRLIAYAKEEQERLDALKESGEGGVQKEKKVDEWRTKPVNERL